MHPAEVVVDEEDAEHGQVLRQFFAEGVGSPANRRLPMRRVRLLRSIPDLPTRSGLPLTVS